MTLAIYQVDAFTDQPFKGNPAAVCILPAPADETWMQNVAAEMNLSETAFLVQWGERFDLRWFTPSIEVELCGHATLASAHVLWESGRLAAGQTAIFDTLSGELTVERKSWGIEMDFPGRVETSAQAPAGLLEALGVEAKYVGRHNSEFLVELRDEAMVREAAPDFQRLKALPVRSVILTSRSDDARFDFVSRFFAPQAGVDEDPVTGSAHCMLGPYWGKRLGKDRMLAYQASRRGGVVHVGLAGERIKIGGQAVTVMQAHWVAAA